MAARKARRKGTVVRGGATCAEVVHHPSAYARDVKQDATCLSQFPRFFAISGRRNFRPVRYRLWTNGRPTSDTIDLKFATFNKRGNVHGGGDDEAVRSADHCLISNSIVRTEVWIIRTKILLKAEKKKCEIGLRLSCTGRYAPREAWRNPTCGTAPP